MMNKKVFDIKKMIRPNVARLKPYASARDEFKDFEKEMIFLDANENPYNNGLNRYPDPQQVKLKTKIAEFQKLSISNILLGNGSDEILDMLFRAFCIPDHDNIIILPPTFGIYKVLANVNDITCKEVLLKPNYQINTKEVLKNINLKTKLIFLCSPNNPTGNLFEKESILELLKKFDGIVVIDEAYAEFSEADSWVDEIKNYPNLVVTRTFSKAYGLAGIRLGVCYANSEIIKVLNKIKLPYNVNQITQDKALQALENKDRICNKVADIKINKQVLLKGLEKVDFIEKIYPSEANFILVKVDDAHRRYKELLQKNIVVRNRSNEPLCENCLRFSIGTKTEILNLLKAINN